MYLLALIYNAKSSLERHVRIKGNFPRDKQVRKQFVDSGFLNYVYTESKKFEPSSKNISIQTGQLNEPFIASKVCDFVQKVCHMSRIDTIPLYNILVELMGNTNQHAYNNGTNSSNQLTKNWYLYAEENKDNISFVFLDTGAGIPATVRKTIKERFRDITPYAYTDADYIYSALNGEYRSETGQKHRGKGLPQISECCRSGILKKVSIYAGSGQCYIRRDNQIYKRDLSVHMRGTLFTWIINKRSDFL